MKNRAKYGRKIKAMTAAALSLGYNNIREAEAAGFGEKIKAAFENAN